MQDIWVYAATEESFNDSKDGRLVEYTSLTIRAFGQIIEATGPAGLLGSLNGELSALEKGDPVRLRAEVALRPADRNSRRTFKVRVESLSAAAK